MALSTSALLRIAAAVAARHVAEEQEIPYQSTLDWGLEHIGPEGIDEALETSRVHVPYAKGVNIWKVEQALPSSSKQKVLDVLDQYAGEGEALPRLDLDESGLSFPVPSFYADDVIADIKSLAKVDKGFEKLFDAGKASTREPTKARSDTPDPRRPSKLDRKVDKYEKELEGRMERGEGDRAPKVEKPSAPRPKGKPDPKPPKGKKKGRTRYMDAMARMMDAVEANRDKDEIVESIEAFLKAVGYHNWA